MTNHVHLLLTAEAADGCALLMKSIGQLYAQYVNKRYGKSGHLWQGRFNSCLVQSENYVLACYRYIELNPVRAGLARQPAEYPWSSYAVNAGGQSADLLSAHEEYLRLGGTPAERQAVYRDLFGQVENEEQLAEIRTATNGGYALGNAAFKRAMAHALGRRVDPGRAGRPPRTPAGEHQPDLLASEKNVVCP